MHSTFLALRYCFAAKSNANWSFAVGRVERVGAGVAVADEPFVILFDDHAGGEPDQCFVVGKDADDVGAAADLAVDSLKRVGRAQLRPMQDDPVVRLTAREREVLS